MPARPLAIEKSFTDKGGKAIDYDRLVPNGTASAYVTFDGNKVGRAQATGVLAALKGKTKPVVAELWGGQSDTNAAWFKSGNDDILNPLFKSGKIAKGPQQFVPAWSANGEANGVFAQMLVKTNNKIDGVIAANDNIAGAVVAQLKAKHLKPIPLSGQDATVEGAQYIISGWQTGTVYKPVPAAGERRGRGRDRAAQGQEAGHDHDQEQRQEEGADGGASCHLDHEGERQQPLHGQVHQEERRLRRRVQEVLLVDRQIT